MSSENNTNTAVDHATEPLRVLFITEDSPLYIIQFFNVFFDEYPRDKLHIIGTTVVDAFHEPI